MSSRLVINQETYQAVLREIVPAAKKLLWLVTADLKDLHVGSGKKFVPFLQILAGKISEGVEVRLIHAKEPGPRFRADFDRFPELIESDLFSRILCPRMHMKCIIADGRLAYIGSANLTGAGLGAKSDHRRNFEAGIVTEERSLIAPLMNFLDTFYLGDPCLKCQRREVCPDPIV